MAIAKVNIRPHANIKMSNMEHSIVHVASGKIKDGWDFSQIREHLEKEIRNWKKRDRYKNSKTRLDARSAMEMVLMNGKSELVVFNKLM